EGEERFDLAAIRYMLAEGRIALLFDGYDELAVRVSYDRALEHFDTLLSAYTGSAKIVVTSRTQHFETDQQVKTALGKRIEARQGARIGRLQRFEPAQVKEFLYRRLGSREEADARFQLIQEIEDLGGLAANPRMLGFIVDLKEDELLAAKGADG